MGGHLGDVCILLLFSNFVVSKQAFGPISRVPWPLNKGNYEHLNSLKQVGISFFNRPKRKKQPAVFRCVS